MGYRDEGEAALGRVQNLENQVAELETENVELRASLAKANAEIERLHGQPIRTAKEEARASGTNQTIFRVMLGLAAAGLAALLAAAYKSETMGMQMSMFAIPLCAGAIGARINRTKSTTHCLTMVVAGALGSFVLLMLFFATVWRSL
jgi:hypothetical protein